MIIKAEKNVQFAAKSPDQVLAASDNADDEYICKTDLFDTGSAVMLLSAVTDYEFGDFEAVLKTANQANTGEDNTKTASVKFMITKQDEIGLRGLGYSESQIDKIKPQEAAEILKAAMKL